MKSVLTFKQLKRRNKEKEEYLLSPAVLSIVIIAITLVLFLIPKTSLTIVSILSACAMGLFGLTDGWGNVFSGFGNAAVLLIAGMGVVSQGIVETGLAQKIGTLIGKLCKGSEFMFVLLILVLGCALSAFINGALVVAILLPICDSLAVSTNGKITRKHCYMPIGLQGPMGNNLTAVSASSMVTCCAILTDNGYRSLEVMEPTLIALPALIFTIIVYMFVAYPLSKKWLNYPDPVVEGVAVVDTDSAEWKAEHPVWKMVLISVIMLGAIIAMVNGMNWGAASLIAACIAVLTGCVGRKKAISSISWTTCIVVAMSMGISAGLQKSGGGALVAEWIVDVAGPLGQSPFGMCVVLFIIANLLSQVMSDSGSVACVVPVTMAIANTMGWDPIPMIICTAMGVKVALATPICVSCMTMVLPGGYRFSDFVKIGGIATIAQSIGILIMTYLVYYM